MFCYVTCESCTVTFRALLVVTVTTSTAYLAPHARHARTGQVPAREAYVGANAEDDKDAAALRHRTQVTGIASHIGKAGDEHNNVKHSLALIYAVEKLAALELSKMPNTPFPQEIRNRKHNVWEHTMLRAGHEKNSSLSNTSTKLHVDFLLLVPVPYMYHRYEVCWVQL